MSLNLNLKIIANLAVGFVTYGFANGAYASTLCSSLKECALLHNRLNGSIASSSSRYYSRNWDKNICAEGRSLSDCQAAVTQSAKDWVTNSMQTPFVDVKAPGGVFRLLVGLNQGIPNRGSISQFVDPSGILWSYNILFFFGSSSLEKPCHADRGLSRLATVEEVTRLLKYTEIGTDRYQPRIPFHKFTWGQNGARTNGWIKASETSTFPLLEYETKLVAAANDNSGRLVALNAHDLSTLSSDFHVDVPIEDEYERLKFVSFCKFEEVFTSK